MNLAFLLAKHWVTLMNEFSIGLSKKRESDELDMTSMVDVTFLLLIFFMVTASFTVQASMDFQTRNPDEPSPTRPLFEDKPEYVSVFVSPDNEYRVQTTENTWTDAPNRHELRVLLKDALAESSKPEQLLIIGHADCLHEKVVQAMDIGTQLSFKIQLQITEELF